MNKFLLPVLFCLSLFSFGQEASFKIVGKVTISQQEDRDKSPITGARLRYGREGKDFYADEKGEFEVYVSEKKVDTLFIYSIGFVPKQMKVTQKMLDKKVVKGMLRMNVVMNTYVLDEHEVIAQRIDTVFGSPEYYVEDYLFQDDGNLLLLAYTQTLKKGSVLLLTDDTQKIKLKYTVPYVAQKLFRSYAGDVFLECEEGVFFVRIADYEIAISKVPQSDYDGFYRRVIDSIGSQYYYSNYSEIYPSVTFFATERTDTTHIPLYTAEDEFMMELYRAEYKYVSGREKLWAYREEQRTGIDKEVIIGANVFTHNILYKPVYAPLFVIEDTIHVFDHYRNQMVRFDTDHDRIDSIPVSYHLITKGEKWKKPIIKDELTNELYVVYNRGGYMCVKRFDRHTGQVTASFRVGNRFVENLRIRNGEIYYIYRPYESIQKKFLYKEKIKFD